MNERSKIYWVVLDGKTNHFMCLRCKESYAPKIPCSLGMMVAMMKQFVKDHRRCNQIYKIPVPIAEKENES